MPCSKQLKRGATRELHRKRRVSRGPARGEARKLLSCHKRPAVNRPDRIRLAQPLVPPTLFCAQPLARTLPSPSSNRPGHTHRPECSKPYCSALEPLLGLRVGFACGGGETHGNGVEPIDAVPPHINTPPQYDCIDAVRYICGIPPHNTPPRYNCNIALSLMYWLRADTPIAMVVTTHEDKNCAFDLQVVLLRRGRARVAKNRGVYCRRERYTVRDGVLEIGVWAPPALISYSV